MQTFFCLSKENSLPPSGMQVARMSFKERTAISSAETSSAENCMGAPASLAKIVTSESLFEGFETT